MAENITENIEFDGLKAPILRQPTHETYLALQPPDAMPYLVAPLDKKPEEITQFITHWIEVIRELRAEMLKRFEKSSSLRCHYQTGDVVHLFGRPFMLRVYPLPKPRSVSGGSRGRVKVKANAQTEVSVINLYVMQTKDYDQSRLAFLSFAKPIMIRNMHELMKQSRSRAALEFDVPKNVVCRPMRDTWVKINQNQDTISVSERLIAYPPDCVVYAFLLEMIRVYCPDISEEARHAVLERGLPNWPRFKSILEDPNSAFAQQ